MAEYVALLRGINVGGNNIIKMTELKACFEEMGFTDGVTYIASGNVLFKASPDNPKRLTTVIERGLSKRFGYTSRIVLVSHKQLKHAVEKAPRGFGKELAKYRYNVIFLKEPLRLVFGAHGDIMRVARLASLSLTHGIASGSSRKRWHDVARGIFYPSVVNKSTCHRAREGAAVAGALCFKWLPWQQRGRGITKSESCTFLSYDSVRELARERHLAHLSESVLDEYAEDAE